MENKGLELLYNQTLQRLLQTNDAVTDFLITAGNIWHFCKNKNMDTIISLHEPTSDRPYLVETGEKCKLTSLEDMVSNIVQQNPSFLAAMQIAKNYYNNEIYTDEQRKTLSKHYDDLVYSAAAELETKLQPLKHECNILYSLAQKNLKPETYALIEELNKEFPEKNNELLNMYNQQQKHFGKIYDFSLGAFESPDPSFGFSQYAIISYLSQNHEIIDDIRFSATTEEIEEQKKKLIITPETLLEKAKRNLTIAKNLEESAKDIQSRVVETKLYYAKPENSIDLTIYENRVELAQRLNPQSTYCRVDNGMTFEDFLQDATESAKSMKEYSKELKAKAKDLKQQATDLKQQAKLKSNDQPTLMNYFKSKNNSKNNPTITENQILTDMNNTKKDGPSDAPPTPGQK